MQKLERSERAPEALRSKRADTMRRRMLEFWALDRRRRAQTSVPPVENGDWDRVLVEPLAKMSNGRCAFCEAEADLSVHRFRPPGNALPLAMTSNDHLYYVWLADAWQNLYPICEGCTPPEPQFPVIGGRAKLPDLKQVENYVARADGLWPSYPPKEVASLLDPAIDNGFDRHFLPKLDGELIGESRKGEMTIAVYSLNRAERRDARYFTYQERLDALTGYLDDLRGKGRDEIAWRELFDFRSLEFGGTWYLVLRRIARWIASEEGHGWHTTMGFIRKFFERHAQYSDKPADDVRDAIEALRRQDAGYRPGRWALGSIYSIRAAIAAVEIDNFKSLETLRFKMAERPQNARRMPSLAILGENATGKTSILEAIALALMPATARNGFDLAWRKMILDPSQMGEERRQGRARAHVTVRLETGQVATMAIDQGGASFRSQFGNHQMPVFAYGAFRRFVSGTRRWAPHQHVRNLFDGSTISNPEPWLKSLPQDRFDMVVRTLRDLLSIDEEFDIIQRERNTRQLRMVTPVIEPGGKRRLNRTPLHALSSGYRSMLAMLCDILKGLLDPQVYEGFEGFENARGIILIDEIEAHLHPRWKVQVMTSLRNALPGMTFIVTTHDPLCLRGMEDGEVMVLQRIAATDSMHVTQMPIIVEKMEGLPSVSDLRIEQLLTSDFFQLFSTDDPDADRRLARVADLIAARSRGEILSPPDQAIVDAFDRDIASALPVGSSEVHRIVQEAVAEFLALRREASSEALKTLRQEVKNQIIAALELA